MRKIFGPMMVVQDATEKKITFLGLEFFHTKEKISMVNRLRRRVASMMKEYTAELP